MSASWDIGALRRHIEDLDETSHGLVRVLASVDRYVDIFRYHLHLARGAMKSVVSENDPQGNENINFVLGVSKQQEEYARAKIASEANILGCIHSARALLDVFAFLVNGLVLDDRISARSCEIRAVGLALSDSSLKKMIQRLLNSSWFGYVSAFVNIAKHRQLVPHGFWISFESGRSTICLDGFEYNGTVYPPYEVDELLRGILELVKSVIDCGKALNLHVLGDTA